VQTRYFHRGYLGSVAILTDEAGNVAERLSFDAWGKRRFPNGQDDPAGSLTSQTTRGFTGHEQLDDVGLVHMNGRVYDPLLGRFGTPDPMTENPFCFPWRDVYNF
jgi:RHS repeat-associated protein